MTQRGTLLYKIGVGLLAVWLWGCAGSGLLRANNITILRPLIKDQKADGTAYVHFDLLWEHSWKDNMRSNWDAAWVFIKGYHGEFNEWNHIYIDSVPTAHTYGTANAAMLMSFQTQDVMGFRRCPGFFIYRRDVGHGNNEIRDIKIKFNYIDHGYLPTDTIVVNVFAIEMVFVPSSTYVAGDGLSTNTFRKTGSNLTVGGQQQVSDMGIMDAETGLTFNGTPVPDVYPKGVRGFYIMKHEISQHAYVDFLNTLTFDQQKARVPVSPTAAGNSWAMSFGSYTSNFTQYRNYIRIRNSAAADKPAAYGHSIDGKNWDREDNGGNIACNFLSWDDGLAYLDWAALRPYTELEFEKACRGHKKVIRGEYAWNYKSGLAVSNTNPFIDPGKATEIAREIDVNYLETGKAPWVMRVGAFAKDSTTRFEAGCTYYGVMNMSDNVWERCINISTPQGRAFVPNLGDGTISMNGAADVEGWPGPVGGGFRGFQVSNRQYADKNDATRQPSYGFRGVRDYGGLRTTDPEGGGGIVDTPGTGY